MPYIKPDFRARLDTALAPLLKKVPQMNSGELNYCITKLLREFLIGGDGLDATYEDYNAAVGVLECAKVEMYSRLIAPYERKKCTANGDVY